jgi:hypothetical protein
VVDVLAELSYFLWRLLVETIDLNVAYHQSTFKTKAVGSGIVISLSLVFRVVTLTSDYILAESERERQGACFKINFSAR